MFEKTHTVTRDAFTWLVYLMLAYYSYLLNGLGPVMPFLRAELNLSYTVSSFHFSAFAIGMLIAGCSCDRISQRFGRRQTFWSGVLGLTAGAILLLLGNHPVLTVSGALLMGTIGSFLLVMVPATLTERFGKSSAVVISEANVMGSLSAAIAPVIIGFFVRINFGWRAAFVIIIFAAVVLRMLFRHVEFPETPADARQQQIRVRSSLPGLYWFYWTILVLAVAVEFCIIFWSSTFLEVEKHLLRADAALGMSLFLGAMMIGRLIGSRCSQYLKSEQVVLGSIGISVFGFLLHWWATPAPLTLLGLFLSGLGVANLYPQLLVLAVGAAPGQTDAASARASLASGLAILLLPLVLGWLADHIGIRSAYSIIILLQISVGLGLLGIRYVPSPAEAR